MISNKSKGMKTNMIGILFIKLCAGTMQNMLCPSNMNCEMLQQSPGSSYGSMLSSTNYPILKDRRCDQGGCMAYLFKDECDICDTRECITQCMKRKKEGSLMEFIKSYAEGGKGNRKYDFVKGDSDGYLKDIKTVTVVDKTYTSSLDEPKVVTVTANEIKTITVDNGGKKCKKKGKRPNKRQEEDELSCEDMSMEEEYKESNKKQKKKKCKEDCNNEDESDKKSKEYTKRDIGLLCRQFGFDIEKCKEYEKIGEKDNFRPKETNTQAYYTQSSNPVSKDVTVTRLVEKTTTVEKPLTLYRELITTITKEKPIINYKVTTITDFSTMKESVTVTKTVTVGNDNVSVASTAYPKPRRHNMSSDSMSDISENENYKEQAIEKTVTAKASSKKTVGPTISYITVTATDKASIETSKITAGPTISYITVTASAEHKDEPKKQSTTCLEIPPVLSTITIGPPTQSVVPKSISVSRAIAKGCEVTTDIKKAKNRTVCRFINVPKDFIQKRLEQGVRRSRRTVIRTVYKREGPEEMNENVVTTTVYER